VVEAVNRYIFRKNIKKIPAQKNPKCPRNNRLYSGTNPWCPDKTSGDKTSRGTKRPEKTSGDITGRNKTSIGQSIHKDKRFGRTKCPEGQNVQRDKTSRRPNIGGDKIGIG
jgi:hypothetical protein